MFSSTKAVPTLNKAPSKNVHRTNITALPNTESLSTDSYNEKRNTLSHLTGFKAGGFVKKVHGEAR